MTSEALERERQLKETQNLYMNLRQVLARQPGPDIQEELLQLKKALKIRGDKMKVIENSPGALTITLKVEQRVR